MLEQYLALEQARFDFSFDYNIHVDNGTGQGKIPSMLLFPFVEQALYKRVLKSKMAQAKKILRINFEHKGNNYIISIQDNVVLDESELRQEPAADQPTRLAEAQIEMLNKHKTDKIILQKKNVKGFWSFVVTNNSIRMKIV